MFNKKKEFCQKMKILSKRQRGDLKEFFLVSDEIERDIPGREQLKQQKNSNGSVRKNGKCPYFTY